MTPDGRRTAVALACASGIVLFLLAFALGWATDAGSAPKPRAVPLAAKPTAVSVTRLGDASPLPELRPAPRVRQRQRRPAAAPSRTTTRSAAPKPSRPARRRAPKPVTIVGQG